jgi:hypothetical protein
MKTYETQKRRRSLPGKEPNSPLPSIFFSIFGKSKFNLIPNAIPLERGGIPLCAALPQWYGFQVWFGSVIDGIRISFLMLKLR